MKKILLFFVIFVLGLALTGCIPTAPEIKDVEIKVTGFQQDVYCGSKTFKVFNGEDYKCIPYCATCCPSCPECPQCPACDSCCEQCEECQECPECEECPTCPTCPTCPAPPPCCCYLKWGDLLVDFKMWNLGNTDLIINKIYFKIDFEDDTEIIEHIDLKEGLLAGEMQEGQAEIKLSKPVKRVIYVVISQTEYY